MTDEERKQAVREYLSARGRIAGKAKAASMTPEARRDLATMAANARWAKNKQEKGQKETTPLPLEHVREYDGAAEHYARHGAMPLNMGSPGAIDWINADPEAFDKRVREFRYAQAMEKQQKGEQ
jgi:hypothetical protein